MSFWASERSAESPNRFHITATTPACVGMRDHQFFMGGVGMAAAIAALETWSEKPLLWSTIQFVTHGMLGDDMELELEPVGGGKRVVQASARLLRKGEVLQQSIAALGERPGEPDRQFATMPLTPPPEDCPLKQDDAFDQPGNLIDQFERRIAFEDTDAGVEHMWIRPKFASDMSAPVLALMSDFFLGAHPRSRGGTSLDNTFRLCSLAPTDWVLAETTFSTFTRGAVQGTQRQFAQDGSLLSISSQTGLLPRSPTAS